MRALLFAALLSSTPVAAQDRPQLPPSATAPSKLEVIAALHRASPYSRALMALPELSEDVEWWAAGSRERLPWAGTWKGTEGVAAFFRALNAEMKYEKFSAEELVDASDRVLAIISASGRAVRTGQPFDSDIVREYLFRNGKIVRVRNFYDTAAYERALAPAAAPGDAVIDHFILAINDLDRGIAQFERLTGVRPIFGGAHPGRGTQNALASLGDGRYIEILAPDPKQPNPAQPIVGLETLTTLTPSGWALGAADLAAIEKHANAAGIATSPIRPGSRVLPGGSRLEWQTLGISQPTHLWQPFFIQWANRALQPSVTSPRGCTLQSVALEDPNPAPVRTLLDAVGLALTITASDVSRMTIVLQCPLGAVTFR